MSLCFVIFYVHVFLFCKSEWFIGLDAKKMREKKRKYRILIFWASLVGEENEEHSWWGTWKFAGDPRQYGWIGDLSSLHWWRRSLNDFWLRNRLVTTFFFFFEERLWLALGGGKWMEMLDFLVFFVFDFLGLYDFFWVVLFYVLDEEDVRSKFMCFLFF